MSQVLEYLFSIDGDKSLMGYPDEEWDGTYRNSKPLRYISICNRIV